MDARSLEKVLEAIGVEVSARGRLNISISCPLASWHHKSGQDRRPSMSISIDTDGPSLFFCFGCKAKGTVVSLLWTLWKLSGRDDHFNALKMAKDFDSDSPARCFSVMTNVLETRWGETLDGATITPELDETDDVVFPECELEDFSQSVPRYLLDRGISIETARDWSLGYDKQRKRLTIPVRRSDGALVGLAGRDITNTAKNRYYNYWNFPKSRFLFGEDHVWDGDKIVIVEGQLDVVKWWQYGIRDVVGLMGSVISERQVAKLLSYGRPIYAAFDNDDEGFSCLEQLFKLVDFEQPVFKVVIPEGQDPDSLSNEEALSAIDNAERLICNPVSHDRLSMNGITTI